MRHTVVDIQYGFPHQSRSNRAPVIRFPPPRTPPWLLDRRRPAQLRVEHYGYTLRKALADEGLAIEESTLYPLLRRLETQGLLTSQWREEDKRNKRFYRLSPQGETTLALLLAEWNAINDSLHKILNHPKGE
jgi:DNA-binding transcriptional ArsR family regulator